MKKLVIPAQAGISAKLYANSRPETPVFAGATCDFVRDPPSSAEQN